MIQLLEVYVIFAFATAVTSCAFLFWPILRATIEAEISNEFTEHPILSVVAYTCIAAIFAPVLFFVLIYSPATANYTDGMRRVLEEQKS